MSDTTREAVARESYKLGFADGMKAYAHWRDSHEEVGTCGTTLKDAVAKIERTWNYSPPLLTSSPREPVEGDEPSGWRDIATAPRDGTTVRLYSPYLLDGDFNPSGSCEAQWVPDFGWQGAVWDPQHDTWGDAQINHATHWMPLPAAPRTLEPESR